MVLTNGEPKELERDGNVLTWDSREYLDGTRSLSFCLKKRQIICLVMFGRSLKSPPPN